MKDLVWQLFEKTGNIAYYNLYKELTRSGRDDESGSPQDDRL